MRTRGYEIFLYHYVRRIHKEPICHPWEMNLGKLIVGDLFVNVEFLKVIINIYNADDRSTYDHVWENFMDI